MGIKRLTMALIALLAFVSQTFASWASPYAMDMQRNTPSFLTTIDFKYGETKVSCDTHGTNVVASPLSSDSFAYNTNTECCSVCQCPTGLCFSVALSMSAPSIISFSGCESSVASVTAVVIPQSTKPLDRPPISD